MRYEDLVLAKKDTLMGLFGFLLGVEDLTGTNCERRIDEVVAMGNKGNSVYNLKSTTGLLDVHRSKYPAELLQFVQEECAEMIYYFGYADVSDVS